MRRPIISFLLVVLGLACIINYSSCDVFAFNTYYIQNKTDTSIAVHVFHKKPTNIPDSVYTVLPDSTVAIHRIGHSVGRGYKNNAHDIIGAFDSIWVYRRGIPSNRNYLSNDIWQFTSGEGDYNAVVTNDEF